MSNLTPWFPEHIKPVHIGVYQAGWYPANDLPHYAYWDGTCWGWMMLTPEKALVDYRFNAENRHDALCWRGLTEEAA